MECPFKAGERIICIKAKDKNFNFYKGNRLTVVNNIGKIYTTIYLRMPSGANDFIIIEDSDGQRYIESDWSCYVTLNEQRRLKLLKLNSEI